VPRAYSEKSVSSSSLIPDTNDFRPWSLAVSQIGKYDNTGQASRRQNRFFLVWPLCEWCRRPRAQRLSVQLCNFLPFCESVTKTRPCQPAGQYKCHHSQKACPRRFASARTLASGPCQFSTTFDDGMQRLCVTRDVMIWHVKNETKVNGNSAVGLNGPRSRWWWLCFVMVCLQHLGRMHGKWIKNG